MKSIFQIGLSGLHSIMSELSQPKFRAKQIWDYIMNNFPASFNEISNIPKSLREELNARLVMFDMKIIKRQESKISGAIKYLIELNDGNYIEAVRLSYEHGFSLCISSQVGCNMGCTFCASTIGGMSRNVMSYELIEQLAIVNSLEKKFITHIVMMGMGEPLDNYDEVVDFIKKVNSEEYMNIGQRHITLSTCGLVDKIKALADENFQITLAISLHNAFDDQRSQTMPINRKYNISELIDAVDYYIAKTSRRVSIEYALIAGVNDSDSHANKLGELLKNKLIHINLIPINPISERDYKPTDVNSVFKFKEKLRKMHLNATIRRELGDDIDGACGQLRRKIGGL